MSRPIIADLYIREGLSAYDRVLLCLRRSSCADECALRDAHALLLDYALCAVSKAAAQLQRRSGGNA